MPKGGRASFALLDAAAAAAAELSRSGFPSAEQHSEQAFTSWP